MSSAFRRINSFWNVGLGHLFEHYDAALFGFLSPFLAPLIFPEHAPITALIFTYAIIPLGMLARPIGSLVFGFIGDVYGRRHALFLTFTGMAFVAACMACVPTYRQVGWLAPLIFCLCKVLQNFFAAGETVGGAIFLLESTPEKRHDILSGLYGASTMGGHLLASLGVFLLSYYHCIDKGWRWLYLCGCITALFGCAVRYVAPQSRKPIRFVDTLAKLRKMLWDNRKALFLITLSSGFAFASYSVALVLMNGFIPLVSSFTKIEVMKINTYLIVLDMALLPFFGWLASKISREKIMLTASLGVTLLAIPLFRLLEGATFMDVVVVRSLFVVGGVAFFAPFYVWAGQLVPPQSRYVVVSLGYALGSQLLGGPTAAFSLWCFHHMGAVVSAGAYWMLLGAASSVALLLAKRLKREVSQV